MAHERSPEPTTPRRLPLALLLPAMLPALLAGACRAGGGDAPARDFAPLFGESLHGFTPGTPAVVSARDELTRASYDGQGRLLLEADGGRFESHVLRWDRPFDELLLSWNVDVPPGAGFYVEVRVGSGVADWSPWLYIGDWGRGLPLEERTTSFEQGEVAVDVLRLTVPHDRARYRISALPGAGGEPLAVVQTALCFSDTTRLAALDPGLPVSHGVARVLAVPARSQKEEEAGLAPRICSPTSVAMVLEHHGIDVPTALVAATIYDADHDIYGNWSRAVQAGWSYGVPGSLVRLSSWRAVEHFLARGVPLIVSIRAQEGELRGAPYPHTRGHLLVIVGFDTAGDVIVNDPAAPTARDVRRTYFREDLEAVWMRNGGVAYAIGPARAKPE